MPVDYAEATKLQDFKVDVYKSSDTPNSQPTAPPPTPRNQLSVPDRDTGLGKPNNLPQRQDSLRNDGQYRTVDVTPESTAKSPPSKQSNQVTTNSATDDAINQAVYYGGFFATGVIDAINENFVNDKHYEAPLGIGEDLAFKLGKRSTKEAIDLANEGIKNGEKLLDDLWRNKPTFEIPQIKIPKFDLPELPDLTPPKFPHFKFPEISFPEPKPVDIPKPRPIDKPKPPKTNKKKQFYIGDVCNCDVSVTMGFHVLSHSIPGGYSKIPYPGAGIFSYISDPPSGLIESPGYTVSDSSPYRNLTLGTASLTPQEDIAVNLRFGYIAGETVDTTLYTTNLVFNSEEIRRNKGYISIDLPDYFVNVGNNSSARIAPPWEIFFIGCIGCLKHEDLPETLPPPPPEDDCCRMGCCPKPTEINYQLIKQLIDKSLKEQKFIIEVPISKCELNEQTNKWTPKTDNVQMEVFATSKQQADQLAQLHLDNARQAADLCLARNVEEPIAVIPEWWQVRAFQRPQLVIQYAELLGDNKLGRSRWATTIPHYNKPQKYKPNFPKYEKGDTEGILVLSDNSKIIINAKNKTECTKVINALKQYVDPTYLKGIQQPKIGDRAGVYKKVNVVPVRCHYFSKGQKDNIPDWSISLRKKDSNKK